MALNHYESAGPMGGLSGGRPSLGGVDRSGGGPNGGNGSAAYHLSTLGRSSSVRGRDPLLPTSSGSSVSTSGSGQSGVGLKNHTPTAKVVDSAYGTTRSSKKVYL